jgi:hypothetical protein
MTLVTKAVSSPEMSVNINQTTWCYIPEDLSLTEPQVSHITLTQLHLFSISLLTMIAEVL